VTSWDVNDLKRINDSMGHAVGDAYLQRFARALQVSARLEDMFFRVGGDEFIGLHLDLHDGEPVIERVRIAFPEVAAGWASAENGLDIALIEADRRMYTDKARIKVGLLELFEIPIQDRTV
jgi:predicted signal transduction protein with EAL and GGDEF domain